MRDVGMQVTPGSGVAAAAEYYRSTVAQLAERAAAAPAASDAVPVASRASPRTAVRA